jgi:hypothetical protein
MNPSSLPFSVNIPPDVEVPRPDQVRAYFEQHPDLAAQVPTLCAYARQEFGQRPLLRLEVYHDPEIFDEYLALYVRFYYDDSNVLERIDKVWERVEKERGVDFCDISGWMIVNPEYRTPKVNHAV